jgi:hypothetical protein
MDEDWKMQLDEFDDADVCETIIELLRANGGRAFRQLRQSCLRDGDREMYERLIRAPRLRDLVPH